MESGTIYTTFSPAPIILSVTVWLTVVIILQRSDQIVMRFLTHWVGLFRLEEIFDVEIFAPHVLYSIYRAIADGLIIASSIVALLRVLRYTFSFAVIDEELLILVDSHLVVRKHHEIPLAHIARVTVRESILHRLAGVGAVEIATSDSGVVHRFGPVWRFGRFCAHLSESVRGACGSSR